MNKWIFLGITFVLGLLQSTLLHYFRFFGVKPDLLMISAVIASLTFRFKWSLPIAIGIGLFKDFLSFSPFGINTLLFAFWNLAVVKLSKNISVDNDIIRVVLIFLVVFLNDTLMKLIFISSGRLIIWPVSLKVIFLGASYTSLAAYLLLRMIKLEQVYLTAMRTSLINWAITAMFVFLGLGLGKLQLLQGRSLAELSDRNCLRLIPQPGCRGKILDRQGQIIVDNYLSYDLLVLPQERKNVDKALLESAKILGIGFESLKAAFRSGFVAPFMPVTIAKNIDISKAIALEELKGNIGDIIIQPRPQRKYPYGKTACHLLGYVNEIDHWRLTKLADYGYKTKDIVGFGGVEEKYDYFLRQEEGALSVEVDHRGRLARVIGVKAAQNGRDLTLTLDLKMQKIVEQALGEKDGSVVLMEPYSGQILAMANRPDFNPASFTKKMTPSSFDELFSSAQAPLINRSISGTYPPGSVFKLVVASAALETKKVNLSTSFVCTGSINVGKRKFGCWSVHGQQNLIEAIAHSCDTFFYRTGLSLGAEMINEYAGKFSFGKPTGIDLPYEESGLLPSPLWKKIYRLKNWYDGDTANFSIGQGDLLTTPLQIARMTAVFANRGMLVRPYILKAVDGKDISARQKKITRLPIKESTINYVRKGMRETVANPSGTAYLLTIPDVDVAVAGKTGTAQASGRQSHGWFTGFFPFENPKFVICVFLEHGGSGYWACTVAKEIVENLHKEGLT